MNNDLISREDLKKAINTYDKFACLPSGKLEPFRNLEHSEMFEPYVHLRDIRNAIDNAPTVDMNTELSVAYLKGRRQGQSEERPQGKWSFDSEFLMIGSPYGSYKCSNCGVHTDDKEDNFCWNCGADMRGKNEKRE